MKYLLIIIFLFNFSTIAESNTEIDINQNTDINLTYKYINDLKIIWSNIYQKELKIKNKELDYLLIIEKYADCEENNVWSAYTLVQFNFFRWRKTILKGIFDEELSKAADEINAQKNEFLKEMVSTSSLTII